MLVDMNVFRSCDLRLSVAVGGNQPDAGYQTQVAVVKGERDITVSSLK